MKSTNLWESNSHSSSPWWPLLSITLSEAQPGVYFLPMLETLLSTCKNSKTLKSQSAGQYPDLSRPLSRVLYPHTFCEFDFFLFSPSANLVLASCLSLPRLDLASSIKYLFLTALLPRHRVLPKFLPVKPSTLDHMISLGQGAEHYWGKKKKSQIPRGIGVTELEYGFQSQMGTQSHSVFSFSGSQILPTLESPKG